MKLNKSVWIALGLLVVVASLYKVWDGRPWGFAPQIAMAIFSGTIIKDKKLAFILPLLSMFLSDALYELLHVNGLSSLPGFYNGQLTNYVLFLSLTVFGFWIRTINWAKIAVASLAAPTVYFLISNFSVWIGGGGYQRPKTWDGLLMAFNDGLPFYKGSIEGTIVFSVILFGGFIIFNKLTTERKHQLA